VLQNVAWSQIRQERLLRFFVLEHPLQMFIAIGIAHIALTTARRIQHERRRYGWTAILLALAMLLILTAIPWPGFYYGRPLLRMPW
jgi:putative effector of murein hydrolase